jgi:hypothetical protein
VSAEHGIFSQCDYPEQSRAICLEFRSFLRLPGERKGCAPNGATEISANGGSRLHFRARDPAGAAESSQPPTSLTRVSPAHSLVTSRPTAKARVPKGRQARMLGRGHPPMHGSRRGLTECARYRFTTDRARPALSERPETRTSMPTLPVAQLAGRPPLLHSRLPIRSGHPRRYRRRS